MCLYLYWNTIVLADLHHSIIVQPERRLLWNDHDASLLCKQMNEIWSKSPFVNALMFGEPTATTLPTVVRLEVCCAKALLFLLMYHYFYPPTIWRGYTCRSGIIIDATLDCSGQKWCLARAVYPAPRVPSTVYWCRLLVDNDNVPVQPLNDSSFRCWNGNRDRR